MSVPEFITPTPGALTARTYADDGELLAESILGPGTNVVTQGLADALVAQAKRPGEPVTICWYDQLGRLTESTRMEPT